MMSDLILTGLMDNVFKSGWPDGRFFINAELNSLNYPGNGFSYLVIRNYGQNVDGSYG